MPIAKGTRLTGFGAMPNRSIRSSHLGWDCYMTGNALSSIGAVKMVKRETRLPPHISDEVRYRLPKEMHWPEPSHTQAHRCIDAVLSLNVSLLAEWRSQWPTHRFGFEEYQDWATNRVEEHLGDSDRYRRSESDVTTGLRKFPIDRITKVVRLGEAECEGYTVTMGHVYFENDEEATRVSVHGHVGEGHLLLSRAYIDPLTCQYDITEHFPGRYKALKLPPTTILDLLGLPHFHIARRSGRAQQARISETPDGQADWRIRRPHSRAVSRHASTVQAVVLGDPVRMPDPIKGLRS